MKFYSPGSRGFFDPEIHTEIPNDAIQMTEEEYSALWEQRQKSHEIGFVDGKVTWVEPEISQEDLAVMARDRRDNLMRLVEWRVRRNTDEKALGITETESIAPVLMYLQALRDIPQQEGFPNTIIWPELQEE